MRRRRHVAVVERFDPLPPSCVVEKSIRNWFRLPKCTSMLSKRSCDSNYLAAWHPVYVIKFIPLLHGQFRLSKVGGSFVSRVHQQHRVTPAYRAHA